MLYVARFMTMCLFVWPIFSTEVPRNFNFTVPPCLSQPLYKNDNVNPDIFTTMYACVDNITDAMDPPSYLKGAPPVETFSSFQVNGMMSLSELEGTATFDFFWRIYWLDQRMNMP